MPFFFRHDVRKHHDRQAFFDAAGDARKGRDPRRQRDESDISHHRGGGRGLGRGFGRRSPDDGMRARVLGRGELPLVVLSLLADAPRHGYEIIRLIEERCRGAYAPSAGVIYPTLTLLEEQGLSATDPASEAGKRRYLMTDAGRAYAAEHEGLIRGAFARMDMVARMRARESMPPRIAQAMETLKQALFQASNQWQDGEVERIARLLEQTAHDIVDPTGDAA